ncbi:MAG: hypothetical protein N4A74_19975 [Carboxylicivirga sp.]|jgi:hypothetical protein|nr:hypothetical protein [Carboxylicivirga sp.]
MSKDIPLVNNLSIQEVQLLAKLLSQSTIRSYYKEEGYGNMERIKYGSNQENRHMLFINEKDKIESLKILQRFRQINRKRIKTQSLICPHCGKSGNNVILKRLNLFQKIYYIGTKPKYCKICRTAWI